MILKAGTYRFNETLVDFDNLLWNINTYSMYNIPFTYNGVAYSLVQCFYQSFKDNDPSYNQYSVSFFVNTEADGTLIYNYCELFKDEAEYSGYQVETPVYMTITQDTEVDDIFGNWYISNTNYNEVNATPLATIEYNGQTIAQLNAGETATLSCEGKRMVSDVVVKVNEVEGSGESGEAVLVSKTFIENGTYLSKDYRSGATITWNGDTTDNTPIAEYFYKVSDEMFSMEELQQATLTLTNGTMTEFIEVVAIEMADGVYGLAPVDEDMPFAITGSGDVDGITVNGTYFVNIPNYRYVGELNLSQAGDAINGWNEVIVAVTLPTLLAPTISIENDILTIIDTSNGTFSDSYDIYANGTLILNTQKTAISLPSYLDENVEYTITVKANANHFNSSVDSNTLTYTFTGYADMIGTWVCSEDYPIADDILTWDYDEFSFTSNGTQYYGFYNSVTYDEWMARVDGWFGYKTENINSYRMACDYGNGWAEVGYKTVAITTSPKNAFFVVWFKNHFAKQ